MPHRYFFQLNKMNTHANKLLSLHKEKQILKNQVLKDKLVRQNLIDSASLYIQPVIDEQEKAKDETIAAIKALGGRRLRSASRYDPWNPMRNNKGLKGHIKLTFVG